MLWDIDHTLIETRGVGAKLYKAAFEETTGIDMTRSADVTGATEPEIFVETLRLNGLDPTTGDLEAYALALARQYDENRGLLRRQGRVLPGAREALMRLTRAPNLIQSVLTGNLRRVAQIKLETFGLEDFFDLDVAAYGEQADERPQLVAVAQAFAANKFKKSFGRTNTILVGDGQSDIGTGKQGGAFVIGVGSGKMSANELADAGADFALTDLRNSDALVNAITNLLGK